MKDTLLPNNQVKLSPDKMIISKTDVRGKITYINKEFRQISGFSRPELIGKPHNVIRHVDMPRGVFKLFWETIQAGEEFNGFVKNRCKNGDYYWVFATVGPSFKSDGTTLYGYFSARRYANPEGVAFFSNIYQQMLAKESDLSTRDGAAASLGYLIDLCEQRGLSYDQLAVRYQTR